MSTSIPLGSPTAVFDAFFQATRSLASCLFRRWQRPKTPLRTLCVVAFDFLARADGKRLGREQRNALSCLLDLGALMNDHFDQHRFCKAAYRQLRERLAADRTARAVYRVYFRELRAVERDRPRLRCPSPEGILKESSDYRERVVRLSLSALAAIALGQSSGGLIRDRRDPSANDTCHSPLVALVMLIQICDDLLDWRRDWRAGLPSFATAALLQSARQSPGEADFARVRTSVETAAATYLAAVSGEKGAFRPFVPCAYTVFLLVKLLSRLTLRGRAKQKAFGVAGLEVLPAGPRC
jgi:hypothetical protein